MKGRIVRITITGEHVAPDGTPMCRRTLMTVTALKYVPSMKEVLRKDGYVNLWTRVTRKK